MHAQHPLEEGSEQRDWLVADLEAASANRHTVPWIVLTTHRAIRCSDEPSDVFALLLEPLLLQYDVDLAIAGASGPPRASGAPLAAAGRRWLPPLLWRCGPRSAPPLPSPLSHAF